MVFISIIHESIQMHGWRLLITKWKSWKNPRILQHFFFSGAIFSKCLGLTPNTYWVENIPNWPWHPQQCTKWVWCILLWAKDRWASCAVMFLVEVWKLLNSSDQWFLTRKKKLHSELSSRHFLLSHTLKQLQTLSQWFIIQRLFFPSPFPYLQKRNDSSTWPSLNYIE